MTTETKVIGGISLVTLLVIVGGVFFFNKNNLNSGANSAQGYDQYIEKNLTLDQAKIGRDYNPKITGTKNPSEATTSSSTKIAVTEFLDYECPACAAAGEPIVQQLLGHYGDRITITRKIFPIHGQPSFDVGRLVLASQIFGSDVYQKLHSKVFETQNDWAILGKPDRDAYLKKLITDLGIDYDKLLEESNKDIYVTQINQDKQDALDTGIKATPSFIINGTTRITGGLPIAEFYKVIDNN